MRMWFAVSCVLFLLVSGCTSKEDIPAEMDSGFDFRTEALPFENFARSDGAYGLTPDLVARMCGTELACENDALPCRATDAAAAWMEQVNLTLREGRSEGIAVMAQLMSLGELSAKDFGADRAADLKLGSNALLQAELAYWAATQSVPSALEKDVRRDARGVMKHLVRIFGSAEGERWRLAIAVKTESGFERGHALVPIGYYRTDRYQYVLRVYDPNFPLSERTLDINTRDNTWRYEMPVGEDETLVYEGNADNGNLLYFSRVNDRLGTLRCPIDPESNVVTATTFGGLTGTASAGSETQAGFDEDGAVVETGGGRVSPAFAACPLCKPSSGILNFSLPSQPEEDVKIVVSGGLALGTEKASTGGELHLTTPTTTTSITGISGDPSKRDQLTLGKSGKLTYEGESGSDVTLSHVTPGASGNQEKMVVTIESPDGGQPMTTSVSIERDSEGRLSVDMRGYAKGTTITLTFESVDPSTGVRTTTTSTVTSTGAPSTVKVNPKDGEFFSADAMCENGKWDKDFEVYIDCGDACPNGCGMGTPCDSHLDCAGGVANPREGQVGCIGPEGMTTCQQSGCSDGILNNDESDVDCGDGSAGCPACKGDNTASPPVCFGDANCDTSVCEAVDGYLGCRAMNNVFLEVSGLSAGKSFAVWYSRDWRNSRETINYDGTTTRFMLPETYDYSMYITQQPEGAYCAFGTDVNSRITSVTGHTGYDPSTTEVDRVIPIICTGAGGTIDLQVSGLPDWGTVKLNSNVRGQTKVLTIGQNGAAATLAFEGTGRYEFSVATQPGQGMVDGQKQYVTCGFGGQNQTSGGLVPGVTTTVTLACSGVACPNENCVGDLYADVTGLPSGSEVQVSHIFGGSSSDNFTTLSADGATALFSRRTSYTLRVAKQPADVGAAGSQSAVECLWANGTTQTTGLVLNDDVTEDLVCTTYACPDARCTGSVGLTVNGLPTGKQVTVQSTLGGQNQSLTLGNGETRLPEQKGSYTLSVTGQPGLMTLGGNEVFVQCLFGNGQETASGTVDTADVAETLTCTQHSCPSSLCSVSCSVDSDCGSNNCECGAQSGNCLGDSGKCGASKALFDMPTSDGVAASGTFTVPAACDEVYLQAWGAAGGGGFVEDFMFGKMGGQGGAGGYVSGYLSVSEGDVFTVWVGQGGGTAGGDEPGGTSGIGSNLGTPANGGTGDSDFTFVEGTGGDGGGLTSLRQTGSATRSVLVGAGGGGVFGGNNGQDVGSAGAGTEMTASGGDAEVDSYGGGGGAGERGGSGAVGYYSKEGGQAGTNTSTLPPGLSETHGAAGFPANASAADYSLCKGLSAGAVGAGASPGMSDFGGDGCVVLRCKAL